MTSANRTSSEGEESNEDFFSAEEIDWQEIKFQQRLIAKKRESHRSISNEVKDKKDYSEGKRDTSHKDEVIHKMKKDSFEKVCHVQRNKEEQNYKRNKSNDNKKLSNQRYYLDDIDDNSFKKKTEQLRGRKSDHSIENNRTDKKEQNSNRNRNNHDKKLVSHGYRRRDKYDDEDDSDNVYKNTYDRIRRMNISNSDEETSSSEECYHQSKDEKRNYKKISNVNQNNYREHSRCDKSGNRGDGNLKRKNVRYKERNDSSEDESDSDDQYSGKYLDQSRAEKQNCGEIRNNDKKMLHRSSHNDSMKELKNNSFQKKEDGYSRRKNQTYANGKSSDLNEHFSRKNTDRSRSEKDSNRRNNDKTVSWKNKNDDRKNPDKSNLKKRNVRNTGIEENLKLNSNKEQAGARNFDQSLLKENERDESRSLRDTTKSKTSVEINIPAESTKCNNSLVQATEKDDIKKTTSFKESNSSSIVKGNITKSGHDKSAPIQKVLSVFNMARHNEKGCDKTDFGKSAALLLPIMNYLIANHIKYSITEVVCRPQALILVPTRELAIRMSIEAQNFSCGNKIRVVVLYEGPTTPYHSIQVITGCHILVSTPGQLSHLLKKNQISFVSIRFLVLDDAQEMIGMGYSRFIDDLINHEAMTMKRQTVLYSTE